MSFAYHSVGSYTVGVGIVPMVCFGGPPKAGIYNQAYLAEFERREKTEVGQRLIQMRCDLVIRHLDVLHDSQAYVLDFGGGAGGFARALSLHPQIECQSFDIIPEAPSEVDPAAIPAGSLHGVTMWDSLEHVEDPNWIMAYCRQTLAPGGKIFISTPALDGAPLQLPRWKHYKPGEHIWGWSAAGLMSFLLENQFYPMEMNFHESTLRTGNGPLNIVTVVGELIPVIRASAPVHSPSGPR